MADGQLENLADEASSLTQIAQEVLKRELARRKLQPQLRESEPAEEPPPPPPELVTLRQYMNIQDALLAKSVLDSAGIDCRLGDENMIRMDWFYSNVVGGVKLWVRADDVAAAASLLDLERPAAFDVEGVGEYKQPRCPNCGSMDVTFEGLNKPVAYGSLAGTWLLGMIPAIRLKQAGWKCHACGHTWEEPPDAAEPKSNSPT